MFKTGLFPQYRLIHFLYFHPKHPIIRDPDYSTTRQKFEFDLELLFIGMKIINYYQIAKIFCVQILCFIVNLCSLYSGLAAEIPVHSDPAWSWILPANHLQRPYFLCKITENTTYLDRLIFLVWHYVSYHVLIRMNDGWSVVNTVKAFNSWL